MALSILVDGVECVGSLLDGSLSITTTSGDRPGRVTFTLLNDQNAGILVPVVISDGATTYFDGTVREDSIRQVRRGTAANTLGTWTRTITAMDGGMPPDAALAPFSLSDFGAEETYVAVVNGMLTPYCWWRLGEASGTTAVDEQGVQDATYVNAPTLGAAGAMTTGNTAVTLNGTDEYLTAGAANLRGQTSITIAAWFKTAGSAADQIIYAERSTLANALIRLYINTSGRPVFQWRDDAATLNTFTVASGNWADDEWHLVMVTKSTPNVYIVVDGITVLSGTQTATDTQTSTMTANIGRDPQAGDQWFAGSLDEVMIYRVGLEAFEIEMIYGQRRVEPYLSLDLTYWHDGISGGFTGEASTLVAGLAPGQSLVITAANLSFIGNTVDVRELTIKWKNASTPVYTVTYGDTPIHFAAAFP